MNRLNKIERLKDALHDTDYKAIKHSEGWLTDAEYEETRLGRQAIRDEINLVENMTDAEYWEAYPEENLPEEIINEPENEEDFGYDGI